MIFENFASCAMFWGLYSSGCHVTVLRLDILNIGGEIRGLC
jgi:hypothetical protein